LNECEVGCTGFQGVFLFIQQQMKTGFILHLDSLSVLDELTNEQAGILFKAIRDYNLGKEPELDFAMRMAFIPFKNQFERDLEKYNNTCERNRNNGSKGGRPKKPTETQETQVVFEKPKKADNKNDNDNKNKNKFIIPTFNDVLEYCMQNNLEVDPNRFINFYESKGWMVGKNKMKDWKAAVRTWVKPKQEQVIDPLVEYVNKQLGL
jgi:hypothetical protein